MTPREREGDSTKSSTSPEVKTITLPKKTTSFVRSVIGERTSATGSRCREPSCASNGRSTSRSSSVSYKPIARIMRPMAPSSRPAVAPSKPPRRRPTSTTPTAAKAHAIAW